jgi:hypothetical protein
MGRPATATEEPFRGWPTDRFGMEVPEGGPPVCPVCDVPYESVSVHRTGLMVGLAENDRYRRVCFDPVSYDGDPGVRFYHHTHEQAAPAGTAPGGDAAGRDDAGP